MSRLAAIGQVGPRRLEMPSQDQLTPWADQIYHWLTGDRLQLTRIQELLAARGCRVSYSSLRRFIVKRSWGRRNVHTVRMADTGPGEVAEADFGRLGMITDPATGRRRVVWALIIVLSYSRHCFVWPTHSQQLEDVIAGLEAAWGFPEYSQHRGLVADPGRTSHPRDKPKKVVRIHHQSEQLGPTSIMSGAGYCPSRRVPSRIFGLHHQDAGAHQAKRCPTGAGGGLARL